MSKSNQPSQNNSAQKGPSAAERQGKQPAAQSPVTSYWQEPALGVAADQLPQSLPYAHLGRSLEEQSGQIGRQGLHSVQRQAIAARIGAAQGNTHLSRVASQLAAPHLSLPHHATHASAMGHIQRQEKKEREEFDTLADKYFTAQIKSAPAVSGEYETVKQGEGEAAILKVFSPKIEMKGKVSVADGFKPKPGTRFDVGPIQAMTSSTRVGVYVKDGKEIARYSMSLGLTRDMRPQQYADDASKTKFKVEQPFYDRTSGINSDTWDAEVSFEDRPQMSVPLEFGGGKLARIEGSDNFVTSIGIKHANSGAIITKNPFGWRTNWDMTLEPDYGVAKDAKGKQAVKGIDQWKEQAGVVVDTPTYAYERFLESQAAYTFQTLEAAMSEPAFMLWMALAVSRQNDPGSAGFIEQALKSKDPTFNVALRVIKPATRDWAGDPGEDTIGVFANAGKQSATKGPFVLKTGGSAAIGFKMSEILEISGITASSKLSIWAGGHDGVPILGDFLELSYPFLNEGNIDVSNADGGSGSYHIKVNMA